MQKVVLLITFLTLLISFDAFPQPFASISSGITGVGRSYMAWGDYDGDGDLDIATCGMTTAGNYLTEIYQNSEGTFSNLNAGIPGVKDGSLEWGDYDMDGDLDLLLTGETLDSGNISMIYKNIEGSFEAYDAGFAAVGYGHGTWGDHDNDGDLDVLITGNWNVNIYNNDNGIFTLEDHDLGELQSSRASWGDFDNDGDLDLLLIGDTGGGYITIVYINEDGVYTPLNLEMEGLFSGTCDWVDFDKDGDMDICVSGYDIFLEPRLMIYENHGNDSVSEYPLYLPGLGVSTVDWGDYDNDGDLDLLAGGKNASCGGGITNVYFNQDGVFLPEAQASIDGSIRCCAGWADYDNDGDLDFLLTGMTPSEVPFTKLYRNEAGDNTYGPNQPPASPLNLQSEVNNNTVLLSWDRATDDHTPQDGLNYNIRLGTFPGGNDILTPMADETSGLRYIQAIGNTNSEVSKTVMNLPEGTYYWSVQAIDQAYAGSDFAQEQTFSVVITGLNEVLPTNHLTIYPNPAKDRIMIASDEHSEIQYRIFNANGQEVLKGANLSGTSIDISSLKEGLHFIQFDAFDKSEVHKLIVK